MPTLTMPAAPGFRASRFGLIANTQTFRSPLDGTVQTLELTGARWQAKYELPPMTRAQAAAWIAFLTDLLGSAGRLYGFDPDARAARGSALGSPQVAGAGQSGKSLFVDGWSELETGLLLPGDYFEVNGELKMVTAQADSDSAGEALIAFTPSLRTSPADNAALTLDNPKATMMLVDDTQAFWDADRASIYGISFSAVEAF
ncbi:MAG: hypothetical protein V3S23_07815 [Kiloniellales bacterium]